MLDLDCEAVYTALDPTGFRNRLLGLPAQARSAWSEAEALELPPPFAQVRRVVVAGMGGSAIGGALLADLATAEGRTPVMVWRDYGLPPGLEEGTLVLVSSYSGGTLEALSAFEGALARRLPIITMTHGGPLRARAEAAGVPVLHIGHQGEPRTAVGYSFVGPLVLLQRLGFLDDHTEGIGEGLALLEGLADSCGPASPEAENPAKALARRLWGNLVVVYGAGLLSSVAQRWKTQINENAKAWAVAEAFPELGHNALESYRHPEAVRDHAVVVLLRAPLFPEPILQRYELASQALAKAGVACTTVEALGRGPVAHILSTLYLGDWTSFYLAMLYREDPSPTPTLDFMKAGLSKP
ncbi:MAG: bifunctional phosphoglucose/phosphomannose isomerase [Chloroflexi bacterium]|nr:bifunctional phosphoglucose/phosphomannose isomerase [Chloroflexota bacterium]